MKFFYYKVYGITIKSEFELPDLIHDRESEPQVLIKLGKVPKHLPKTIDSGVLFETAPDDFLFQLSTVGAFRVQNGSMITIEPNSKALPEDIQLFLLGSTMGALMQQRGITPIHGSAVKKGNKGVVITGNSGSGKSSLAAGLLDRGYDFLADDISVFIEKESGEYEIQTGIPQLKLWKDVLDHLNNVDPLEHVRPQLEKYKKGIKLNCDTRNVAQLFFSLTTKNTSGFQSHKVEGHNKFLLLRNHTYRLQYVNGLGMNKSHFEFLTSLANAVIIYEVERPNTPLLIDELADHIDNLVK